MLLDANLLLYAVDADSPYNERAASWLTSVLRGDRRVGLPWASIGAFLRISTHPRVFDRPLTGPEATAFVTDWLETEPVWIPPANPTTFRQYAALSGSYPITGNLVPDALLAALAIEHGLTVMTTDTDFGRFPEVRAVDPLR